MNTSEIMAIAAAGDTLGAAIEAFKAGQVALIGRIVAESPRRARGLPEWSAQRLYHYAKSEVRAL